MIRIDEPTPLAVAPSELHAEVVRRSKRLRRRRRARRGLVTGSAVAVAVVLFIGAVTPTNEATPTRVGTEGSATTSVDDESETATAADPSTVSSARGNTVPTTARPSTARPSTVTTPTVLPRSPKPLYQQSSSPPLAMAHVKALVMRQLVLREVALDGSFDREAMPNTHQYITRWSPDGTKILARDGYGMSVLDPRTGQSHQVFQNQQGDRVETVAWMPDSRRVAFTRLQGVVSATTSLWIIDWETRALHKVRDAWRGDVSVTPNGRIAYQCQTAGGVMRMCLTDGGGTDLGVVPNSANYLTAQWSPDGKWIAFLGHEGYTNALVLLRPDGSERRVVVPRKVNGSGWQGVGLAWFPDSSRVAFDLELPDDDVDPCTGEPPCPDDSGIWSVRLDGSDVRPVTSNPSERLMDIRAI